MCYPFKSNCINRQIIKKKLCSKYYFSSVIKKIIIKKRTAKLNKLSKNNKQFKKLFRSDRTLFRKFSHHNNNKGYQFKVFAKLFPTELNLRTQSKNPDCWLPVSLQNNIYFKTENVRQFIDILYNSIIIAKPFSGTFKKPLRKFYSFYSLS